MLIVCSVTAALVAARAPADKMVAPRVRYTWTAPVEGSPVSHYRAEILVNGLDTLFFGPLSRTEVSFPVAYGNKYEVRVVAVDEQGNQGPYSNWSLAYSPELDPPDFLP